ncbi:hypothetical protein K458DRAFT_407563 [Lentithecium fluviatile CBS 122367]|uniref:Uncharacterized protein n=1 Tax=Lentithecium fluviatile CBS 122367 TaxID=1168545 RepID=A0A6G1IPR4_9PLEO|nr:hypothetical protein K458DRAFT_407563 [Lentithecium fluviatile CBS 122367]
MHPTKSFTLSIGLSAATFGGGIPTTILQDRAVSSNEPFSGYAGVDEIRLNDKQFFSSNADTGVKRHYQMHPFLKIFLLLARLLSVIVSLKSMPFRISMHRKTISQRTPICSHTFATSTNEFLSRPLEGSGKFNVLGIVETKKGDIRITFEGFRIEDEDCGCKFYVPTEARSSNSLSIPFSILDIRPRIEIRTASTTYLVIILFTLAVHPHPHPLAPLASRMTTSECIISRNDPSLLECGTGYSSAGVGLGDPLIGNHVCTRIGKKPKILFGLVYKGEQMQFYRVKRDVCDCLFCKSEESCKQNRTEVWAVPAGDNKKTSNDSTVMNQLYK